MVLVVWPLPLCLLLSIFEIKHVEVGWAARQGDVNVLWWWWVDVVDVQRASGMWHAEGLGRQRQMDARIALPASYLHQRHWQSNCHYPGRSLQEGVRRRLLGLWCLQADGWLSWSCL